MTVMVPEAIFAASMAKAEEQRGWIDQLLRHLSVTPTTLSREAGVDPSTLSKFLAGSDTKRTLHADTIGRIERRYGIRYGADPTKSPLGFREPDAVPFDSAPGGFDDLAVRAARALCEGRNATDPWVLRSRALEGIGLLPGDILVVDLNEPPKIGDIVCAQVYGKGTVETVFRLYEAPMYLVGAGPGARKPVVADGENAQIRGVVIGSFRPRGIAAAVA